MAEEKTDLYRQGKKTEVERISLLFQTIETLRRKWGGEGKNENMGRVSPVIVRALNVDRGYISNIKNGKRNPTLATFAKIAEALKVSVD